MTVILDQSYVLCLLSLLQQKFEIEAQEVAGSQFSVSQQESSAKTAVLENALDIKVNEHLCINPIGCGPFFSS